MHLLLCLGSIGSVGEFNITKALGATRLAVGDDTAAGDLAKALELAAKPVLVDIPA
jgi:hypothetical protein